MTRFWIGGSPCAGKSSVAAALAARHGLRHFECDRGTPARMAAMSGRGHLAYEELVALPICARLARPPEWQAEREREFYHEQFAYLLAELPDAGVIAEGADLLPELLAGAGVPIERAVWIVPAPEFQRRHYAGRPWVGPYLAGCPDPAAAFESWMRRDALFARHVRAAAEQLGGRVLVVDGALSLKETVVTVERHFGLRPTKTVGGWP